MLIFPVSMWSPNQATGGMPTPPPPGSFTTLDPSNLGSLLAMSTDHLTVSTSVSTNGADTMTRAIKAESSGKYYLEAVSTLATLNANACLGIVRGTTSVNSRVGDAAADYAFRANGRLLNNGTGGAYGSVGFSKNQVMQMAVDLNAGSIWWGADGTWYNSGDPAAGTNAAFTGISGTYYPALSVKQFALLSVTFNFGNTAFAHSAPSGFTGWTS